ncbi:MAG: MFS transporter [Micromonosporaceae bacterium]|nr:MFS transporter [Micromonosporaceae bacterium]
MIETSDTRDDAPSVGNRERYRRGSRGYRRVTGAMFASGVATFALLHNVQAVLPLLSDSFDVSPAQASLAVSIATGTLALGAIPVSVLSERFGRVRVMTVAMATATVLGLLTPLCPSFPLLLLVRGLQGLALAGLPAVAVAYLGEEIHPTSLATIVGTLIGGNSLGGLAGRLLAGAVADPFGWRAGLASVALLALACGIAAVVLLPRQQHFRPVPLNLRGVVTSLGLHLRDSVLLRAYAVGGLVMAAFVTLYNYVGYRLIGPPFSLPAGVVGLVFLAYLAGTASSAVAGRMTERTSPRLVLVVAGLCGVVGALLTLPDVLPVLLVGVVVLTVGFFAAHSVASGLVGQRADSARAQASSLYTLIYYLGASVGGWAGGLWFERLDWPGVVGYLAVLLCGMIAVAATVRFVPEHLQRTPLGD